MGLDQYAYSINKELVGDQQYDVDFRNPFTSASLDRDFAYWRKFHHLHGWMHNLYVSKGGKEEFNCVNVRLMPEDVDQLERDCKYLKPTAGFFFGYDNVPMDKEDMDVVHAFIANCREAFAYNKAIFYDSWW